PRRRGGLRGGAQGRRDRARRGAVGRRALHGARGRVPRRVRLRAGGAGELLQPRSRDAGADARADRGASRRRGAGARARACVPEFQGGLARARRPRGGAGVVTTEARLTRNWGNPEAVGIDGYVAAGGYEALRTAVGMTDADIVEQVKASGLRGRGGAGFTTGMKWGFVPRDTGK